MRISGTVRKVVRKALTTGAIIFLGACVAAPMSPDTMRSIDKSVYLGMVRHDPQTYRDKVVLTGGEVISVKNSKDGGELEVLEYPLDYYGTPTDIGDSPGRFLARSPSLLDPLVFKKGRLVTLAGAVNGTESRTIDGANYAFVVLAIREIHAWRPPEAAVYAYPGSSYYYDPFFYDPYYFTPYYSGRYTLYPSYRSYEGSRSYEGLRSFEGGSHGSRGFEGQHNYGGSSHDGGHGGGHGGSRGSGRH